MYRKGYICYDTRIIPTFEKESMIELFDNNIYQSTLFDANSDFHLEICGNIFRFEKGMHYLPNLCPFHPVKLIDNFENVKRYRIVTDDNYFIAYKSMCYYVVVFTNIFNDNNENLLMACGMSNKLNIEGHDFNMLIHKCYYKPNTTKNIKIDISKSSCSKYIYSHDVSKIQKDSKITDLLENWDKDFIRESFPPCIAICYKYENHDKLEELLNELYRIKLGKYNPDDVCVNIEESEINNDIEKFNLQLNTCESKGYFKFVDVAEPELTKCINLGFNNLN